MYSFNNKEPIYIQLISIIKTQIINGTLKENEKVKSVRDLAVEYGVNPNTVQRSLTELERQGFIYTERTTGRFVALPKTKMKEIKTELAASKTTEYLEWMESMGFNLIEIQTMIKQKNEKGVNNHE